MQRLEAFKPTYGSNQEVSPAVASASVSILKGCSSVLLMNTGANICHVRIGKGAQTATAADLPVPPNSGLVVGKDFDADTLAHISASGTTLQIMVGEGKT